MSDASHLHAHLKLIAGAGAAEPSKSAARRRLAIIAGGSALCAGLVLAGLRWPAMPVGASPGDALAAAIKSGVGPRVHPIVDAMQLVVAAVIGLLVTVVQKETRREKPLSRSMEHAQVLLCVSGAMMMIIVGDSLARAFGIAGAASVIRFRTPVDDPKDITILFLLMALGMATGLGALVVAGLGTLFLCVALVLLEWLGDPRTRTILVEVTAEGPEFPSDHVHQVFARHRVQAEPREIVQGEQARAKFLATFDAGLSLDLLSEQLVATGRAGVRAVSWETRKAA